MHPSELHNYDRKYCSNCLAEIMNRSMYMKCETCEKNYSQLFLLCAACHNANQVINKHNSKANTKHVFRAYLHRIVSENWFDMEESEGADDDWKKEGSLSMKRSPSKQTSKNAFATYEIMSFKSPQNISKDYQN